MVLALWSEITQKLLWVNNGKLLHFVIWWCSASILLLYRWPHRTPKWPPGLFEHPRLPELPSEYIYKNPETIRTVLLSMMFSCSKVEKILKGSQDSIPSPSPSVKVQIMCAKFCFRCKGKTLLGAVNKLFVQKVCCQCPECFAWKK